MKTATALVTAILAATLPFTAAAAGYGHQQTLAVGGNNLALTDTSARILGNADGSAPQLVDDITDGQGKQKIPGYKIQIMSRAYSTAHNARPPREGQSGGWRDNMYIHRGIKILAGIPVSGGYMDLNRARLLGLAVIDDSGNPDNFKAEDKIRPRGKQLVRQETKITKPALRITALTLPDMASGEQTGGGVKLEASALIDKQPVTAKIDSTFTKFETAKPDAVRGFGADKRLMP